MSEEGRSVLVKPRLPGFTPRRTLRSVGSFDELLLPKGQDVEVILIDGNYQNRFYDSNINSVKTAVEPFYRYLRHPVPPEFQTEAFQRGNRSLNGRVRFGYVPCTKNPDRTGNCVPCEIGHPKLDKRERFVFTVIHLAKYHMVPTRTDPNKRYPKLCVAGWRECEGCAKGYEVVDAARRYVEFTSPDYEVILQYNTRLQNKCICGGQLGTVEFSCPRCGTSLMRYSRSTAEDFAKVAKSKKYYCQTCNEPVMVAERKKCSMNCESPAPFDIFKVALTVQKADTGRNFMQIMIPETRPALDLLEKHKKLAEPLDLPGIFAMPYEEQKLRVYSPDDEQMSESR